MEILHYVVGSDHITRNLFGWFRSWVRCRSVTTLAIVICCAISFLMASQAWSGGGGGGQNNSGGRAWRFLSFVGTGERQRRTYLVLGVDLDSAEFASLAPLTAYIWARAYRADVTPLVLATSTNMTSLSPAQTYILAALAEAGARVELFPVPAPHHPVTGAQVSRLLAFSLPGISPDDYLITSDVDLWPLSQRFWDRVLTTHPRRGDNRLWIYNGLWTWKQIVRGQDHLAMSLIGATARTWCTLALHLLSLQAEGSAEWRAAIAQQLSALFRPDVRWDPADPPSCIWRRKDGALRMRFPGRKQAHPSLDAAASSSNSDAAAAGSSLGGRRPPSPAYQRQLQPGHTAPIFDANYRGGGGGDGAGGIAVSGGGRPPPIIVTPTLATLVGAALEAGRILTGGAVWPRNMTLSQFKKTQSKLWYFDQIAVSLAEKRMGLCPTVKGLGRSSALWPRCHLNRDVRRLNRASWSIPQGAGPANYTDAHVHPKWVLDSPHRLLKPWGWVDPQAGLGSPFFHRYLAGLAELRRKQGLKGPPVPVRYPPPKRSLTAVMSASGVSSSADDGDGGGRKVS